MYVKHLSRKRRRKGVILLVVISLLTLFAVVGLSFVLYSEGSATSARIWREARQDRKTEVEIPPLSDEDLSKVVGELVYGVDDQGNPNNVGSMWYGHDIASAMYGWKQGQPAGTNINTVAYGGPGLPGTYATDRFVRFAGNTGNRRPEYYPDSTNGMNPQVYIPKNADYTYPDQKDFYLAALDPASGRVTAPSFHRNWIFDWTPGNPDVTVGTNRDRTLRPHPVDHPEFPYPQRGYRLDPNGQPIPDNSLGWGDVENLPNKNFQDPAFPNDPTKRINFRQFDSFWMDVGFSVREIRGKKYKPLIAPLILDLDGRLNLNVAGNLPGGANRHDSNQGWGPWEMNPAQALKDQSTNWANSIGLLRSTTSPTYARFGGVQASAGPPPTYNPGSLLKPYEGRPSATTRVDEVRGGASAPQYANVDFDASAVPAPTAPFIAPIRMPYSTFGTTNPLNQFQFLSLPVFNSAYGNGGPLAPPATTPTERTTHPSFFNPYYFNSNPAIGGNKSFSLDNFRYLNHKYDYDAAIAQSELYRVYPSLMPNANVVTDNRNRNALPRWLTTVISNDLDRVGYMPWQLDVATHRYGHAAAIPADASLTQPTAQSTPTAYPAPQAFAAPTPDTTDLNENWQSKSGTYAAKCYPDTDGRFGASPLVTGGIAPLDLSRPLADYREDPTQGYDAVGNVVVNAKAAFAVLDRQNFARDIFERLVIATFGVTPTQLRAASATHFTDASGAVGTSYPALQWLAQLAANMVDYIDGDDYMTPFFWNPARATDVVYGTEMPRLAFNEIYTRWSNDPTDLPMPPMVGTRRPATRPFHHEVFIELINPMALNTAAPSGMSHDGGAVLRFNGSSVYRLAIWDGITAKIRDWKNTDGAATDPAAPPLPSADLGTRAKDGTGMAVPAATTVVVAPFQFNPFDPMTPPPPSGPDGTGSMDAAAGPPATYRGFYLIGPKDLGGAMDTNGPTGETVNVCETVPELDFSVPLNMTPKPQKTYLLQRLACPHLPPQPTATMANFNPYITVDYLEYGGTVYDNRHYDEMDANMARVKYAEQYAQGREQPYAGLSTTPLGTPGSSHLRQQQNRSMPPPMAMSDEKIQHTFYHHNFFQGNPVPGTNNLVGPFHWLRHLDRVPINAMELLHVSAYKPHELTHEFIKPAGGNVNALVPYQHLAQWFDYGTADAMNNANTNALRLSRFLGLVSCRSRMFGIASGGRVPGRINVNSVWRPEVLQSAFDPQSPTNTTNPINPSPLGRNQFNDTHVEGIFTRLTNQRTPTPNVPGPTDRPFHGPASPVFFDPANPQPVGVANTLLKPNLTNLTDDPNVQPPTVTNAGLLSGPFSPGGTYNPAAPHPYWIQEPLTKTLQNFTTRSNCFLFICTVGYFEYDDTNPGPPKLKREIGNDDGTSRRDKFMAIIDRSNLAIDPTQNGGTSDSLFRKVGPKPVTYSYEPISVTATPPSTDYDFLSDVTLPTTVTVRVPTAYAVDNGNLVGFDDGGTNGAPNWVVVPKANSSNGLGTYITIDTGDNAETVEVQTVSRTASNGSNDAGGGEITFRITKPHRRGALMLFGAKYLDTATPPRPVGGVPIILGNPGPQKPPTVVGGFDYTKEPFNAVVPYVVKDIE